MRRSPPAPKGVMPGLLPAAAVLLAGALLYAPALGFDYTYYDDHPLLVGLQAGFASPRA
jgi:hypothetical protein